MPSQQGSPTTSGEPLGRLDLRDIKGYMERLEHSDTAEARDVRVQLENGTDHLAYQRGADRRLGIALEPAGLQAPIPPPEENAAQDYERLLALLLERPLGDANLRLPFRLNDPTQPPSEAEVAAMRALVAERQDVLDLIRAAQEKSRCVFERDWENGLDLVFRENFALRDSAMLLRVANYLQARDGRFAEAASGQTRLARTAEHVASDPILLCLGLGQDIEDLSILGLEDHLYLAGPDAEVANRVGEALLAARPALDLPRALGGENTLMAARLAGYRSATPARLSSLQDGQDLDPEIPIPEDYTPEERDFLGKLIAAGEATMRGDLRALIRAAALKTDPARLDAFRRVNVWNATRDEYPTSLFVGEPVVSATGFADVVAFREARRAVTRAAAALLAFRAENGVFPERLEEAAPNPPLDPFTDFPLGYRREGEDGFVVFSIGVRGVFDGGTPATKFKRSEAYFRYPALPPAPA